MHADLAIECIAIVVVDTMHGLSSYSVQAYYSLVRLYIAVQAYACV
jgi:hypothetical protein